MNIQDVKKAAKRAGLKITDRPTEHPNSCHCWRPLHGYRSAHAWWCPCSPQYQVRRDR